MILSIETKGPEIEELKRQAAIPEDGIETVELPWGKALGFWGEMTQDSAELVVLLELNAAMMNREEQHRSVGHPIEASVHAHAYSCNSTMAVALEKLFKLGAQASEEKPSTAIDLKFQLTAVRADVPGKTWEAWCTGWGVEVHAARVSGNTDEGRSYQDVELRGKMTLAQALHVLRTLLTALDADHVQHLGEAATIAIAQANDLQFPNHPDAAAIRTMILSAPNNGIRISKGNLAEPMDRMVPAAPRVHFADDTERVAVLGAMEGKLKSTGIASALVTMPEGGQLTQRLAASESIQRIHVQDLVLENIQRVVAQLRDSDLSDIQKQKISFSTNSPVHFGEHLMGFDAIILETGTTSLPSHQRPALLSALLNHSDARLIAMVQRLDAETKSWANAETAKAYGCSFELVVPKAQGSSKSGPMALLIFHANRA